MPENYNSLGQIHTTVHSWRVFPAPQILSLSALRGDYTEELSSVFAWDEASQSRAGI